MTTRVSPGPPGKVVTGGPVRPTGTQDKVQSPSLPAAPRPRLENSFAFRKFQRRAQHRRLTYGLLFSLLAHALLLRVTFGGQGWLPGFGFPWQDRRIEVPDLRVSLVPAKVTAPEPAVAIVAEPLQQPRVEQAVPVPAPTPSVSRAPTPQRAAAVIVAEADRSTDLTTDVAPVQLPLRAEVPADMASTPDSAPAAIALMHIDQSNWLVPVPPPMPTPVIVPSELEGQRQERGQEAAQTALADNVSLDVERREAARAEAARVEAARVEAARAEAARAEAARAEATRVAAAQEDEKREAARRALGRQLEEEAARRDAAAADARQPPSPTPSRSSPRPESAPVGTAQDPAAREAMLRALGRQLDEEADRRDVAAAAARQSPLAASYTSPRRYRLFGRSDPNAVLMVYAENWSRKIEMNMTSDRVREAAKQPHTNPLVTVAIRSDGSVESVTFVLSSGVAAIDRAIRGVVESQAPYPVFPPALALEYDVIEIRRTWHFDVAIRLH